MVSKKLKFILKYYVFDLFEGFGDLIKSIFSFRTWFYIGWFVLLYSLIFWKSVRLWVGILVITFYYLDRVFRKKDWEQEYNRLNNLKLKEKYQKMKTKVLMGKE